MRSLSATDWKVPAALMALSGVPLAAGLVRLAGLASGAALKPEDMRFAATPLPLLLHVLGAAAFCVVGALQFSGRLRRRQPGWHRAAGWVAAPCGLLAAMSGVWMALFYPIPPLLQGGLLMAGRLAAGAGMVFSIGRALWAIGRRDVTVHSAWMVRGYALAQGAGTQVLVFLLWLGLVGGPMPTALTRDLLMCLAWLINIAVAECIVRRAVALPTGLPLAT